MPIERKPLFRPDVVHQHLVAFQLPHRIQAVRPKQSHWADLMASGRANKLNEKEPLPDFLTNFVELLGTRGSRMAVHWSMGTRHFPTSCDPKAAEERIRVAGYV